MISMSMSMYDVYREAQGALKKCHPTKVDGFYLFSPKSRFSLFPHIPYNSIMLGVVRHFSRVARCFSATNRLPIDLSQN